MLMTPARVSSNQEQENSNVRMMSAEKLFCVNRLCVRLVNASFTCSAAACSCLPRVVCVSVFSDECAALSSMSLHQLCVRAHLCVQTQCFVSAEFVPLHSRLTPGVCVQVRACTRAHTHAVSSCGWHSDLFICCVFFPLHLCQPLICPPYPASLSPSLPDGDLTQQNLASSRCLPECKCRNVINLFDFYQVTLLW